MLSKELGHALNLFAELLQFGLQNLQSNSDLRFLIRQEIRTPSEVHYGFVGFARVGAVTFFLMLIAGTACESGKGPAGTEFGTQEIEVSILWIWALLHDCASLKAAYRRYARIRSQAKVPALSFIATAAGPMSG